MKDSINYFCFDLDGTLLDSQKAISHRAVDLIKELKNNGKRVILASGRHLGEILPYSKELQLADGDYLIACDGQYVFCPSGMLLHEASYLTAEEVESITKGLKTRSFVTASDGDYIIEPSLLIRAINRVKRILGHGELLYRDAYCLPQDIRIEKVRFYSNGHQTDIKAKGVNKMMALKSILGDDMSERILFFGNDMNDYECFKELKSTVAMADSPDEIKSMARYITDDCDHDGVGSFLARYYEQF